MPPSTRDFYTVLGILREASAEDVRRAYLQAAHRLHPDHNVAAGDTELFLEVQQAYETLSNPERRRAYDATLPASLAAHPLLRHSVTFSRPGLVETSEPQLIYILLEVGARDQGEQISAPPLNVCLVLDRSSSMKGEKLDMAKAAGIHVMRSLRPQDISSIVAFSDKAEVLIRAGERMERAQQEARIQMLRTSGGTEILQGLQAAMSQVRRSLESQHVHHIILLTDGHTYGDERAALELAEEAAALNIGISCMGIGNEWNDVFLDQLASRTGGSSAYISKARDIQPLLLDKFSSLAKVFANDVTLEYTPRPGVKIEDVFRLRPEGGPVAVREPLLLGPILQDSPLLVLFEFSIQPSAATAGTVTLLDGLLHVSISGRSEAVQPVRLRLEREVTAQATIESPPESILRALSHLSLYRMQERAHEEADSGDYEAASLRLKGLATRLHSRGEHELATTALLEAEHLAREHRWSQSGRKDLKYNTRALLLTSGQEPQP